MELTESPLVNKEIQLEKFSGKGGWTFVRLPEIPMEKRPFGLKKVRGYIDDYEIKNFHLMPLGNGQLFLPVKAEIRKKIHKEEGDSVKVVLYNEEMTINVEEDFILCLKDDPDAWNNYLKFSEPEKKNYLEYINSSKNQDIVIERMAEAVNKISQNKKLV